MSRLTANARKHEQAATPTLRRIAEVLAGVGGRGGFAARRTAGADDLRIEVKGVGPLRFPVPAAQARLLRAVARPARYGRGEQTLLDARVRDTWEVPKSRVKIDGRRWNRTLLPILDELREDLGLPDGHRLKAELHSMLVYMPGQFFLPHQDSQKSDDMVGTLVVTLPSRYTGGAFVVEHGGERVTYRASKQPLSFVAFYADCRHELKPVKQGHRIVLTYNLMLKRAPGRARPGDDAAAAAEAETVEALATLLREHFATTPPPRWAGDSLRSRPPDRFVYLLDHEYTERGFGWDRLKGDDAARVAALLAAAERAGCEAALALAEVHETWQCEEAGWDEPWYGRRRRWARGEDDEWYADHPPVDDPDGYNLVDLIERGITLHRWIDAGTKKAQPIATHVYEHEACSTTPSSELEPYASEYEGYMGNYGDTMDRWYRRAAVVLSPRARTFAVRAEASPAWAVQALGKRIRSGGAAEARELAAALLPFWTEKAPEEKRRGFFTATLRVADGLAEPDLAAALLGPFRVEALTAKHAALLAALVTRYGEAWARSLVAEWSAAAVDRWERFGGKDDDAWLTTLPRLCEALLDAGAEAGGVAARAIVHEQWCRVREAVEALRELTPPSERDRELDALAGPVAGLLEAAALVDARHVRDAAVSFFCADENEWLLPCLIGALRAGARSAAPERHEAAGLDAIRRHCIRLLEARLAAPAREPDDWSIALVDLCGCELCRTLGEFLAAPDRQRFEWPLAKPGRKHVHRVIDERELPVRHETRRSGRPFTLVLSKQQALFERDAAERRAWREDLEELRAHAEPTRPRRPARRRR